MKVGKLMIVEQIMEQLSDEKYWDEKLVEIGPQVHQVQYCGE